MSRVRDVIEEIAEVRRRRQFGTAMVELPVRLASLEQAFRQHDRSQTELTRYFPVALIACIESYFQMAITDLVDSGEPFLTNAEAIAPTKLVFRHLRAVQGKTVSIGELMAHGVSVSRLEHIEGPMTAILGASFLDALKLVEDRWLTEMLGPPIPPMLENPGKVFEGVKRTFELRHIICHEIASAHVIDAGEIDECFESCVLFLKAADEVVSQALQPGPARTQSVMNAQADEALKNSRTKMSSVLQRIRADLTADEKEVFDKSQELWEAYSATWAEFCAREHIGSIRPFLYATAAEGTVLNRLADLFDWKRLSEAD